MLYQTEYSAQNTLFHIESKVDFSFPIHYHENMEVIYLREGEMRVTVGKTCHTLRKGQAIVLFPRLLHALETVGHSAHTLWIFSPAVLSEYLRAHDGEIPADPVFTPPDFCVDLLLSLSKTAPLWRIQAAFLPLLAAFDPFAKYEKAEKTISPLLFDAVWFVQNHYAGDCSLTALSRALGYHPVYLSRFFRQETGSNYNDYVVRYRVRQACALLAKKNATVLAVACECGFGSLRSFNRNFRAVTGETPQNYRLRNKN